METEFAKNRSELKSKFSKYGTKQLLSSLPNKKGLEKKVVEEILASRGRSEAVAQKPKPFKYLNVPKGVLDKFEKAKLDRKKSVTFHCKALDRLMDGIIIGVRLDPRSNLVQYLIRTNLGVYGKSIHSENIKFKP